MGHKEQLPRQWAGVIMGSLFYYSGDASIDVNELTHLIYGELQKIHEIHDSITISHIYLEENIQNFIDRNI